MLTYSLSFIAFSVIAHIHYIKTSKWVRGANYCSVKSENSPFYRLPSPLSAISSEPAFCFLAFMLCFLCFYSLNCLRSWYSILVYFLFLNISMCTIYMCGCVCKRGISNTGKQTKNRYLFCIAWFNEFPILWIIMLHLSWSDLTRLDLEQDVFCTTSHVFQL